MFQCACPTSHILFDHNCCWMNNDFLLESRWRSSYHKFEVVGVFMYCINRFLSSMCEKKNKTFLDFVGCLQKSVHLWTVEKVHFCFSVSLIWTSLKPDETMQIFSSTLMRKTEQSMNKNNPVWRSIFILSLTEN